VLNKSKTIIAPRLLVLFYVQSNLFCTAWEFAPTEGLAVMPAAVRLEGSQAVRWRAAGGRAGRAIPPSSPVWSGR